MSFTETKANFEKLFNNDMSEVDAREFLIDLYKKGETTEDILAATEVMREHSIKLSVDRSIQEKIIDNCGTGGDKSGSFNISTTVSIVLASAGCYVAKHGNRSITSNSGSADMLEALGVKLDLNLEQKTEMLHECGFTFLFAQNHHPAMKHIMPIRKSLPHRTIFNILGPLTNPADVKKHLIGVFDSSFATKMASVLQNCGSKKGYIVHSNDGLDEVSVCSDTKAVYFDENRLTEMLIEPAKFGLKKYNPVELLGGNALENAKITYTILKEKENGAKKDIVVINSAVALVAAGIANTIHDGVAIAKEMIDSSIAFEKLEKIISLSQKL